MPAAIAQSSIFSFPAFSPLAPIAPGVTEAETLSIGAGFTVASNPHPSGGAYLQATASASQAGGVFDGGAGYYDLTVAYFDESDGVSTMEVLVNGSVVAAFDWDSSAGDAIVTAASKAAYSVTGLLLAPGDVIELRGAQDGGEPLRTDTLEIVAAAPPSYGASFVVEAEHMQIISGFSVVANGAASGRQMLQQTSPGEARAAYTVEHSGSFDVAIGYFDETDGASWMQVLLNGSEVAFFNWDSNGGAAIASTASLVEEVISGLALEAGDVIELVGQGDGGEPLRTDYLTFTSVPAGPPGPSTPATQDLWYLRDGEIHVALNDGSGGFAEIATGIAGPAHPSETRHYAVDVDGDGDLDFLEVSFGGPAAPLPDPIPDELIFNLTTTVYENDGTGGFSVASAVTEAFSIPLDPIYGEQGDRLRDIFNFGDAGDLDGDGDIDFTGTSVAGQELILMLNDGDGSFTKTLVPFPPEFTWGELMGGADVYLSDINDDGALDILFSIDWEFSTTLIMISDGAGGYDVAGGYGASDDGNGLQIPADLDGDGDLDVLFVAVSDGGGIYAYLSDGTGARQDPGGFFPSLSSGELNGVGWLQVGDFDGTPGAEMASAGLDEPDEGFPPGLRLVDFVPTGDSVEMQELYLDPSITGQLTAQGDFDGDGDLDLILATEGTASEVLLLLNDGSGQFSLGGSAVPDISTGSPYSYGFVQAGDFGELPIS